ncbi:MAG: GntR family transcriptional regulator [Hungatella sp.]|nr:GntR family transcriptional regulator [Hungatella sp.]
MEIEKKSLVDEAYEKIRQKICDFELVPGQAISDFILSKELGMSRTPIRMALQKIESDGLIRDGGAGQSYFVCEITKEDIEDLFDARKGIELTALELMMKRGAGVEDLEYLRRINERMEEVNKQGHVKQQFYYDQRFHDKLVLLSANSRIIRFHESLLLQFTRMRVLSYLDRSYQDKAYRDHDLVLDMIEKGDKEGASAALRGHIETAKQDYIGLLTNKLNSESFGVLSYTMKSDRG